MHSIFDIINLEIPFFFFYNTRYFKIKLHFSFDIDLKVAQRKQRIKFKYWDSEIEPSFQINTSEACSKKRQNK